MKYIPLTQGKSAIVDDEDFEKVSKLKWWFISTGYARTKINSKQVFLHRFIINLLYDGKHIDHINGDGLDNRKSNLRVCTPQENCRNRKLNKNNTSGYKGVSWRSKKKGWESRIKSNDKYVFLGIFKDKLDAIKAYDEASKKYHGAFGKTNAQLL